MSFTHWHASRAAFAALALAGGAVMAVPAAAQSDDARLRKIEAEVRALQRTVFPNGGDRFFTPEVVTPSGSAAQQPSIGTPSETALTDMLARLDAIESQLARLTAGSEVNENALSQLEERLLRLEGGAAPPPAARPTGAIAVPPATQPVSGNADAAPPPSPALAPAPGPSAERLARVQAIAKPDTGDAGDDEYTYGFRLWEAGFFPEAEQQLKLFVDKYPAHSRISFGRNLLGRAYLDDDQPRVAAPYFLENYQKDPIGLRAPDSLLYLAETMIALKDTARACRALAEFGEKYPALATGRLQDQYDKDRKRVTCS
jgi:TolA-binding protein